MKEENVIFYGEKGKNSFYEEAESQERERQRFFEQLRVLGQQQELSELTPVEKQAVVNAVQRAVESEDIPLHPGFNLDSILINDAKKDKYDASKTPFKHLRDLVRLIPKYRPQKRNLVLIPEAYQSARFEDFKFLCDGQKTAWAILTKYNVDPPMGIFIHGNFGTGKTHLLTAFTRGLVAQLTHGYFARIEHAAQQVISDHARNEDEKRKKREFLEAANALKKEVLEYAEKNHMIGQYDEKGKPVKIFLSDFMVKRIKSGEIVVGEDGFLYYSEDYKYEHSRGERLKSYDTCSPTPPFPNKYKHCENPDSLEDCLAFAEMTPDLRESFEKVDQLKTEYEEEAGKRVERYDPASAKRHLQEAWAMFPYQYTDAAFATFDYLFEKRDDREFLEDFLSRRIIVIDDIHPKADVERAKFIQDIVEYRYNKVRQGLVFITSNLDPQKLLDVEGYDQTVAARIYSRIGEMCMSIKFDTEDYRRTIAMQKVQEIKKLIETPQLPQGEAGE